MVREQIIKSLLGSGMIPVIVSADTDKKTVDQLYKSCAGLVIPGGADIHPIHYYEEVSPRTVLGEPLRDMLEIRLARQAVTDKKPILAICRGMQILWVSQGGKLIQHLPDITRERHGNDQPAYKDLYKPESVHKIFLKPGTEIAKVWKSVSKNNSIKVPSMHHQAIQEKSLGMFTFSARSKEQIVEAIELPKIAHPFCIGVQGHPEAWTISKKKNEKIMSRFTFCDKPR
jgi:putative glutamine amidotransferase